MKQIKGTKLRPFLYRDKVTGEEFRVELEKCRKTNCYSGWRNE